MKSNIGVAVAIVGLTVLSYFALPGHTYLQQDTQIYVPILEHLWDSSVLTNDILVQRPHVAFTLYDELALAIRKLTGADFHTILTALQILTRGFGLWGVYLIALSILNGRLLALLVTTIASFGASIDGPAVLIVEIEPSPRALAVPLIFLAIGLMAWKRPVWAGTAAAVAFVLHPPSVLAFWIVYFLVDRRIRAWVPFGIAIAVLLLAAFVQPGVKESQPFFFRISPELEHLQRMRASYNWVSMWWATEWWKHILAGAAVALAFWRIRRPSPFLLGLPIIGLLSVPLSYLLLEKLKWGLIPQVQPARTLLFGTAVAILLAAICGCLAIRKQRWLESAAWLTLALLPSLPWNHHYPALHTPELQSLASWARQNTPKDAVFAFPLNGRKLDAGIFRSEALRAVYVDWKGGGQVNYLPELGEEWWTRWQDVMLHPIDFRHYRELGIDYVVTYAGNRYVVQSVTQLNDE